MANFAADQLLSSKTIKMTRQPDYKFRKTNLFLCMALLLLTFGCGSHKEKTQNNDNQSIQIEKPAFSADSALAYTVAQCAFGPRVPNSEAHKKCGNYLISFFQQYGDTVCIQSFDTKAFDGTTLHARNIICSFNPQDRQRIVIASHWDSRPYADQDADENLHRNPIDGANDGAAGVGILMEIARQLHLKNPDIGVDLICFDVEDYGPPQDTTPYAEGDFWCLGSQYWAKNPHTNQYRARYGILLDMVGGENATFGKEGVSWHFAPDIVDKVWKNAQKLGYGATFVQLQTPFVTDDHLYVNQIAKIPMIDIIEYDPASRSGFYKHWHTSNDNTSNLSKTTMQRVGEVILATLYSE